MPVSDCVCVTLASRSVNALISSAEVFGAGVMESLGSQERKTVKSFF